MTFPYETDLAAWADEQAALLRSGNLAALDAPHLAEEIGAVCSNEKRELGRRVSLLTADLVRWKYQVGKRCEAWRRVIRMERTGARLVLEDSPSLRGLDDDARWCRLVWADAVVAIGLSIGQKLPDEPMWPMTTILDEHFWPD